MEREQLRQLLQDKTGCAIQHDGWPCNTCFHSLDLGLSPEHQHDIWESILAYRGDYSGLGIIKQSPDSVAANINELITALS